MKHSTLVELKLELLTKTVWALKDLKDYFQISHDYASELKHKVLSKSPNIEINRGKKHTVVLPDEVFKFHGTTRKKELENLKEVYLFKKEVLLHE